MTQVLVNGKQQRFCQLCSIFHELAAFEGERRFGNWLQAANGASFEQQQWHAKDLLASCVETFGQQQIRADSRPGRWFSLAATELLRF